MNEAFLLEQLSFYLAHLDNNYIAVNNWHGEAAVRLMEKFIETGLSLGDEQSAETYEMVFAAWLGTFFLDLHHYISLRPFYSHEQWMEFFNEAEKHKVNGDDLLERVECWGLENYSYHGDAYDCEVEKGDIVIDLGAFTGNTPIYFAQKTGVTGHVYAFEATPKTVEILRENLALKHVANVSVIPLAVSDKEEILYFPVTSSGTNKAVASGVKVSAVPLDLWVEQNEIKQIDFIKMDIEGAEMSAIEGAKNTIKRFSPKLAISVYHNPEHFFTVPKKVLSINPNYKLFVNHGSRD
ncbi:MAG: FkbM family methyltransferase, partial [Firmicutes bacterium]|nr:FkbM family methyltransferase [Bacillota bacterium]